MGVVSTYFAGKPMRGWLFALPPVVLSWVHTIFSGYARSVGSVCRKTINRTETGPHGILPDFVSDGVVFLKGELNMPSLLATWLHLAVYVLVVLASPSFGPCDARDWLCQVVCWRSGTFT